MSNPRFSIIPAGAVTDRSLEPRDLQVLCLLGRHTDKAGWCIRSQVKMAIEIDCGRSSVQRSLERLCDAGWVQKKQRGVAEGTEPGQPSASYSYRVILDRDDYAFESLAADNSESQTESHAENASEGDDYPPVGTPDLSKDLPTDGHPGAQPCVGTGAQPYVGTKNVPLERPPIERERDARARDRKARFLVAFEARWPTAAADNRQRTAYAADALTEAEEESALAGIAPFLENQKRLHRKNVPAGWRYLEEKRWTLLEAVASAAPRTTVHERGSVEAKAIGVLFKVAKASAFFHSAVARGGVVSYPVDVTPRLVALAQAGPESDWLELTHQQAGAWDTLMRDNLKSMQTRKPLVAGDRAPWPWPPSVEGKLYATAGPPDLELSEAEMADFK